ncbi:pimeloyl-ACP methyl ester esterase BioH [Amphritea sp. HPY]|uniref:pimeloyl-ACP methyl ester esterase BioH n=1 Tax=Amphritea sp. HPY TaxID=3421652 RepID=UPI003D7D7053
MSLYSAHYGNADGTPLVLLHGWGMHSGVWQPLLEQLSDYSITLIDLPGLGRSAAAVPEPYTLDAVSELLAEVAPEQAAWLGWSLGGIVAMAFADRYPQRVSKLVTLASSPCFVQRGDWTAGMDRQTFNEFEAAVADNPAKTLQRFNMLQVQGSATARADLKQLKAVLAETEMPHVHGLLNSLALLQDDYRDLFAEVEHPALHILCQLDTLAPADIASQLTGICPQAETAVLPGQSHVPFISSAEQLASVVDNWI